MGKKNELSREQQLRNKLREINDAFTANAEEQARIGIQMEQLRGAWWRLEKEKREVLDQLAQLMNK